MTDTGPFLGRIGELRAWRGVLTDSNQSAEHDRRSFVVLVHGIGGMGKSRLVERLCEVAEGRGAPYEDLAKLRIPAVLVDLERERARLPDRFPPLEGPSIGTLLYTIERAVCEARGDRAYEAFADFRGVLAQLIHLVSDADRVRIESEQSGVELSDAERKGLENAASLVAGLLGVSITAPVVGAGAAVGTSAARVVRRFRRKNRAHDDETPDVPQRRIDLALDAERVLVRTFADGLRRVSEDRGLVVAIDTGEIATRSLGAVRDAAAESGSRLVWLIAGRFDTPSSSGYLDSAVGRFEREIDHDRLAVIPISAFNTTLQREYLLSRIPGGSLTDADFTKIDKATRGIPLGLSLVVEMIQDGVPLTVLDEVIGKQGEANTLIQGLAERFLHHALRLSAGQSSLRDDLPAIFGLVADETVDAGKVIGYDVQRRILAALLAVEPSALQDRLDTLAARHDFVLAATGRVHEEVARVIRKYMLGASQRLAAADMHDRANEVIAEELQSKFAHLELGDQLANEAWRVLVAAFVRHEFWASNDRGVLALCHVLPPAVVVSPGFARVLREIADRFYDTATSDQQSLLRGLPWPAPSVLDEFLRDRGTALGLGAEERSGLVTSAVDDADRSRADEALARRGADHVLSVEPSMSRAIDLIVAADRLSERADQASDPERSRLWERVVEHLGDADRLVPESDATLSAALARRSQSAAEKLVFAPAGHARRSDAGLKAADISTNRDPTGSTSHWIRAVALREAGHIADALSAHERAVELDHRPTTGLAHSYALTLALSGNIGAGEAAFDSLLASRPTDVYALRAYAVFLRNWRGDYDRAVQLLKRAHELAPSNASIIKSYANALRHTRDTEAVPALLERAIELAPHDNETLGSYALFLADTGRDAERARELYERALEVAPQDPIGLGNFARLLLESGEDERGQRLIRQAFVHAGSVHDPLREELWFYLYALGPEQDRPAALVQLRSLIKAGVRSFEWDLSRIVARACALEHPECRWLEPLADVISGQADEHVLEAWSLWADLAAQEADESAVRPSTG